MERKLKDSDIRAAAKSRMLSYALRDPHTRVIDELGLEHGASRVDIAVVNGHLRGLEIKAEADTLDRLPRQVVAYGRVVDMASLIVAERHIAGALPLLPSWWGVIEVGRYRNGTVAFRRLRPERANPGLDPLALARLLWRAEVVSTLSSLGGEARVLDRLRRADLYAALVEATSRSRLRAIVREALKCREGWRDRARPSSCDDLFRPNATY